MKTKVRILLLSLLTLGACYDDTDPIVPKESYENFYGTVGTGLSAMTVAVQFYYASTPPSGHFIYGQGESLSLEKMETINFCFNVQDDPRTFYVQDTVCMQSKHIGNNSLHLSWTGSLGALWDAESGPCGWPHEITLQKVEE